MLRDQNSWKRAVNDLGSFVKLDEFQKRSIEFRIVLCVNWDSVRERFVWGFFDTFHKLVEPRPHTRRNI